MLATSIAVVFAARVVLGTQTYSVPYYYASGECRSSVECRYSRGDFCGWDMDLTLYRCMNCAQCIAINAAALGNPLPQGAPIEGTCSPRCRCSSSSDSTSTSTSELNPCADGFKCAAVSQYTAASQRWEERKTCVPRECSDSAPCGAGFFCLSIPGNSNQFCETCDLGCDPDLDDARRDRCLSSCGPATCSKSTDCADSMEPGAYCTRAGRCTRCDHGACFVPSILSIRTGYDAVEGTCPASCCGWTRFASGGTAWLAPSMGPDGPSERAAPRVLDDTSFYIRPCGAVVDVKVEYHLPWRLDVPWRWFGPLERRTACDVEQMNGGVWRACSQGQLPKERRRCRLTAVIHAFSREHNDAPSPFSQWRMVDGYPRELVIAGGDTCVDPVALVAVFVVLPWLLFALLFGLTSSWRWAARCSVVSTAIVVAVWTVLLVTE